MRLDKFLSQTGKFTRAEAKKVIKAKRVRLNGEVVKDGKIKINEDSDKIFLDGELLALNNKEVYYMLNKPIGVVSATRDDKDKTVIDLINFPGRKEDLFPVGRLDKETTGLLIITNDGKFAHDIISPKKHVSKTYEAVVTGKISEKEGDNMSEYVITTDNNSDLPEEYLKDHGVGCMYLSYSMDGKNYTHGNFLPEHEFYEAMRNGSMPTTAQVNPENAKALLEPYLKEGKDILHIAFSSALSGTYNSSRIAAEELMEDYPDRKIIVVDSLGASLGQGLLVYLAQEKKEQ